MQIVIEIDEDYYNAIKAIPNESSTLDMLLIKNGTPLPEYHGRLISEEDMLSVIMFSKLFDVAKVGEVKEALLNIPTIIEGSESECQS